MGPAQSEPQLNRCLPERSRSRPRHRSRGQSRPNGYSILIIRLPLGLVNGANAGTLTLRANSSAARELLPDSVSGNLHGKSLIRYSGKAGELGLNLLLGTDRAHGI